MRKDAAAHGNNWGEFQTRFNTQRESGVVTDQFLVSLYAKTIEGRDVHAIGTDQFINKSKDTYNAQWLVRELVQNFVDHNQQHPGTLDGVDLEIVGKETDPSLEEGVKRFVITGHWSFKDPTGIISPHSEKPPGMQTAGGNGIGLKQAALRFLRDFGVKKFLVAGEKWMVDYNLVKASEINDAIAQAQVDDAGGEDGEEGKMAVRHDWLVGDLQKTKEKGSSQYVIETNNPELIDALSHFREIGVCTDNKYLSNPDVVKESGTIKWLPNGEHGRVYINGQVFNWLKKGKEGEDYWMGPEGVTLRFNNLNYQMSVDRPPLNRWDLSSYFYRLCGEMTQEELVAQVRNSEHLWSANLDGDSEQNSGCLEVVEAIVSRVVRYRSSDVVGELVDWLKSENYLAANTKVSDREREFLQGKGHKVCPGFFKDIGLPTVSSVLSETNVVAAEKPTLTSHDTKRRAQREGIEVGYEQIDVNSIQDFAKLLRDTTARYKADISPNDRPISLKMEFPVAVEDGLAYSTMFRGAQHGEAQMLVVLARALAAVGLSKEYLQEIYFQHGNVVVSLAVERDYDNYSDVKLISKVIEVPGVNQENFVIHLTCASDEVFDVIMKTKPTTHSVPREEDVAVSPEAHEEIAEEETAKIRNSQLTKTGWVGHLRKFAVAAGLIGLVGGAGKLAVEHQGQIGQLISSKLNDFDKKKPESPNDGSDKIDKLIKQLRGEVASVKRSSAVDEYQRWLDSNNFYGEAEKRARYFGGVSIRDLLGKYKNVNGIEPVEGEYDDRLAELNNLVEQLSDSQDKVKDFKIVEQPTQEQVVKLALLRSYFEMVTGIYPENQLFIFTGDGALGINIGQSGIGIHANVINGSLDQAMSVFSHEVSHNYVPNHGLDFIRTFAALSASAVDNLYDLAARAASRQPVTDKEMALLSIESRWNQL